MNPRPETLSHLRNRIDLASTGEEMLVLMGALNPICRSISGDGLRQSLGQLAAFLPTKGVPYAIRDFSPYGYDERQYCSPGFNLPVGSFRRTPHGEYPEYHTSGDNLDFVSAPHLADSLATLLEAIDLLENDLRFVNLSPMGEPQLGRRGLVPSLGGKTAKDDQLALLWVLNLSDGTNGVLDIAERSDLPFDAIRRAVDALTAHGLLDRAGVAAQIS
jgi:aminopeptidase-like protein